MVYKSQIVGDINAAVDSVSNVDGTLTISPNTGAVVASLNTSHNNSWSGTQSFSSQIISIIPTGTPPLIVASTTQVANLNAATAGSVSTNANSTGPVTSVGNATTVAIPGLRNALINGAAEVAQRGTSFATITSTARQTLDCWAADAGGSSAMAVSQQTAPAATNFNFTIQAGRPNGNTDTGQHRIFQIIETINCMRLQGQVCTLSFYALAGANFSAASSNLTVKVGTGTGSNQGSAAVVAGTWTGLATPLSTTQAITTTLTRYSASVTIGATATEIYVQFSYVPVGTAGAADYFQVTGAQLEIGTMNAYEYRPFEVTLAQAMRFYQKTFEYATAPAQSAGVGNAITVKNPIALGDPSEYWQFSPPLFQSPAITTYNPSAGNANWRDITAAADATVSVDPASTKGTKGVLIATSGTVTTLGDVLAIHAQAEAAI